MSYIIDQTFSETEYSLTADLAYLAKYCQQWHLKLSTSKTVRSVFHLHNIGSRRDKPYVRMNGQRLRHDPHPVYIGVTLDWTLSYREHWHALLPSQRAVITSSQNLQARHGCLCKNPTPLSPGSLLLSHRTLLSSVGKIQLHQSHKYSTTQFHAPDFRLPAFHSGRRVSGTLYYDSTFTSPQSSKRQDASDHWSPSKLVCLCSCVWTSTSSACLPTPNLIRRDTCRHNCAVERALAVCFCGQLHHCNWPYYLAAWFQSTSSVVGSAELFLDRSRPMPCNSSQMGPCQITDMWLWPAADYEPYHGRASIDKAWWQTTTTSQSQDDSHVAGVYSNYSICEMKLICSVFCFSGIFWQIIRLFFVFWLTTNKVLCCQSGKI